MMAGHHNRSGTLGGCRFSWEIILFLNYSPNTTLIQEFSLSIKYRQVEKNTDGDRADT